MSRADTGYVPGQHPDLPPPSSQRGAVYWLRTRLFNSWLSAVLTVLSAAFLLWAVPPLFVWAFVDAAWTGTGPGDCPPASEGACWAFVGERMYQYLVGFYPRAEVWRPFAAFAVLVLGVLPVAVPVLPGRQWLSFGSLLSPFIILALLAGGPGLLPGLPLLAEGGAVAQALRAGFYAAVLVSALAGLRRLRSGGGFWPVMLPMAPLVICLILASAAGLEPVSTAKWGGLSLSLVVGVSGIVASLPLGILLALGRQSSLPMVKAVCVFMIEVPRGVPLITLLFMASVMLPLFVPDGVSFDKLLRALVVVALFASAYMAEVIRGGLQAIPKGQAEAAAALGLGYWQTTAFIVMPQALRIVIPGIVNTFIGLFKDTTLVMIIGLYDLLGIANAALQDADWLSRPGGLFLEVYLFVAAIFWVFTFGMSRYSAWLEGRLDTGGGAKGAKA